MFYSVKLTREKGKNRPKRGKNRRTHTQLLHARNATRTWQIFRTHACFLRFNVLLSLRETRILLEACIHMFFKNIFAMWEIEVRRTDIFKLLRKKYQNNLYHCLEHQNVVSPEIFYNCWIPGLNSRHRSVNVNPAAFGMRVRFCPKNLICQLSTVDLWALISIKSTHFP